MNDPDKRHYNTVVFISFENHYAPHGGLAAVMKNLPPVMSKSIKTTLISPLFPNIKKTREAIDSQILIDTNYRGHVLYKGYKHEISLFKSTEFSDFKNYDLFLVKSDNFFLAGEDPYNDTWRYDALFHDSYFFSKSIPIVLNLIKEKFSPPYMINLQDWETALVADSIAHSSQNKLVLTLHNPYDEYLPNDPQGRTVLQLSIPKIQGLSTVSEHFAYELQHDVLHQYILTHKLKTQFQLLKPIGINNGNFVNLSFPEKLIDSTDILHKKLENRRDFNTMLMERKNIKPKWGNNFDLMSEDLPLFLLFGRDDPNQKGFDLAAAAIYKLLKKSNPLPAFFIFASIPGPHGLNNFGPMQDLASEFHENVMVFPSRLSEGYDLLQSSANYIIMPSYYEPFGAANEGYASGVPVIARATGGLIQQVCPKNYKSLPEKIKEYVKLYHGDLTRPTGYLYREQPNTETAENWKYLLSTDFSKRRSVHEPVDWRNPVFWSMVSELEIVLEEAIKLYEFDKETYCEMIINGINLFKEFSWEKTAKLYRTLLYDTIW
ncbi:MAG: glycogen/starch synthase [Promethearchaeota archaeon]